MCTVVILRRPGHAWPLLVAANRDEMADRPSKPPARHWPDRAEVVAGLDVLAGGAWLGLNDHGVIAGVLNRPGTLGPEAGLRSRGELPLEALDHAEAEAAAAALSHIDPAAYRPFNLFCADRRRAFCVYGTGHGVAVEEVPPGLSMITAHERNDTSSPRIRLYLPRFRSAAVPDPGSGDWTAWRSLLASRLYDADAGPEGAMNVDNGHGFATVSSSLISLSADAGGTARPLWLHAHGDPASASYEAVEI